MSNTNYAASAIALAVAATIGVLGAAVVAVYEHIREKNEQQRMSEHVQNSNRRFVELEKQVNSLRSQGKRRKARGIVRKQVSSANSFCCSKEADTDVDGISITSTETADDEFFDCSDAKFDGGDNETRNSRSMRELANQLAAVDEKVENEDLQEEALSDLRKLLLWHDDNVEVIWRLARACSKNADSLTDQQTIDNLLMEGIQACERVLDVQHADLHKWYAILVGSKTEFLPLTEKLENGMRFQKHVNIALAINPTDDMLHYLLGRFKYSVSGLSWLEKRICNTIFGDVPSASYEEVIGHLEEAVRLRKKPDIEYKYYLGMAYVKTKCYEKGIKALEQVCKLPAIKESHKTLKNEAKDAISQYSNYL